MCLYININILFILITIFDLVGALALTVHVPNQIQLLFRQMWGHCVEKYNRKVVTESGARLLPKGA